MSGGLGMPVSSGGRCNLGFALRGKLGGSWEGEEVRKVFGLWASVVPVAGKGVDAADFNSRPRGFAALAEGMMVVVAASFCPLSSKSLGPAARFIVRNEWLRALTWHSSVIVTSSSDNGPFSAAPCLDIMPGRLMIDATVNQDDTSGR